MASLQRTVVHGVNHSCAGNAMSPSKWRSDRPNNTAKAVVSASSTRNYSRNDDRYEIRERLKASLAKTTRQIPAKQLERLTGIPFRTIEGHRTGLVLCSFEDAVKYIKALPSSQFTRDFLAMVSGDGEANSPQNIDRLVRVLNTLRRGT
ncbi:MAG: hypothetical protein GC190_20510 [Alphaproteobacteria bacterium]|nr:hypothetical protein [Alphaproteobacteria bacterium]